MSDYFDPEAITKGAGAVKTALDTVRGLIGLFKDAKEMLPDDRKEAATLAIESSTKQLAIAEAQIAQALGYQLCKCAFPPVIMLTVGTMEERGKIGNKPVYECPSCGSNTAHPWGFDRNNPPASRGE